nr:integrase, catalytic region, zinc finger, CCHC-type, peptidase aspartic, catalytic [Tanacetum cinerariifolium]
MNMTLALMAKAFKLNYSTPTNNNQRISSNPRNRQIAKPGNLNGYNAVQNVENQVAQNPRVQNVGNQNGLIGVLGNGNQNGNGNLVLARAEGNAAGHNGNQIRCCNCRGVGHFARNCMVRPRRRDAAYLQTQLLIAQKEEVRIQRQAEEFDVMAAAGDLDEIEEVNANCILMANLQQASTSGTQSDKAPIYDSDGSAEYTELLEPIPEPHQIPQNDNNVIFEVASVEQSGRTVEQHPANVEETRVLYDSLYQNLAIEVEKVNSVNRKLKETNAYLTTELARFKNQEKCFEISQEKYDKFERCYKQSVYQEQCLSKKINALHLSTEKEKLTSDFKTREDELLDKQIQLEKKIKELNNILVKTESREKMKQLNKEIKLANCTKINHLSGVFVSQSAKSRKELYFSNDSKTANVSKSISIPNEEFSDDTTPSVARKFLNEVKSTIVTLQRVVKHTMTLETHNWSSSAHQELHKIVKDEIFPTVNQVDARVQNFEIQFLKEPAKFVEDYKSLAKEADESLAKHKASELEIKRLLRAVDNKRGTSANTKFPKQSIVENLPKVGETHALSIPVTSNSDPTPQESKVVKNDKVIALGMFRINPFMTSREKKRVPNNVRASTRTKLITVSQPSVIIKKDVNSDSNGLSSTGIDNTKTRRPQPRSNTKNDRVPSASKSSRSKNKDAEVIQICLWCIDSGCSKHMTENLKLLINFVWKFMGTVRFGNYHVATILGFGDLQWGNILITRVYFVEGLGHNLFSVGQLCDSDLEVAFRRNACFIRNLEGVNLLKGGHSTNLYTINLHEMASASPICLIARASSTKSWLWHQRLSHLNFDTINDLPRNDLVSGLPNFKYNKEHLCPSCEQGKNKRASHPPKPIPNSRQRLYLLRMDLCGPMRIASINGKWYVLVIVDDYSRYKLVHFLRSKDEAPETLVEAARTMLIFSRAPLFLWAEAIATACFTQNRSIIHLRLNKTPYELINDRKPDISFLYVFGAHCYPKNDRENIRKLGVKGDIGFFIGYSADSCAYRIFNRRTTKIMETMNVLFNELSAMAFEQRNLLFEAMYDDYLGGQPSATTRTVSAAQEPQVRQMSTASTSIADTVPTPTNSSSQATNILITSQDVDELNLNAMFNGNTLVNPFANPSTCVAESSSSQNVDQSNMHTFYQPYPHEF